MKWVFVTAFLFATLVAPPVSAKSKGDETSMENTARLVGELICKVDASALYKIAAKRLKSEESENRLAQAFASIGEKFGRCLEVYDVIRVRTPWEKKIELWILPMKYEKMDTYWRTYLNDSTELEGFYINMDSVVLSPHKLPNHNYKTKTKLTLPFKGRWVVAQGGFYPWENHHMRKPYRMCNTFAYDFLTVNENNNFHKGDGKRLEDYFCFGTEVTAPADGRVVQAVDGVADTPLGADSFLLTGGNIVVIDHENKEYSLVAHLKQNSVRVKAGDVVKRGDVIGLCGNSGASSISVPHIHYQLQNSQNDWDAAGLPVTFSDFYIDGELKKSAQAAYGDIVEN